MGQAKQYDAATDRALNLWIKLARAFATFNRLTSLNISNFDVTLPQFSVIESLGHLGPLPVGELCRKMLVSGGNMTVVLDNLEKEGLVKREHSQQDRRSITISLTRKGENLFHTIFPAHAERVRELASVLTEREQEQLAKLLKKLGTTLQEEYREE